MKPYYRLSDFENLKTTQGARNYMATCPECGKHHLSISKEHGLFHCFTPGCDFNGRLKSDNDFLDERVNHGVRPLDSGTKQVNQWGLTPLIHQNLKPSGLTSIEANAAVVKYLEEQKIPLEVAKRAGCMAAERVLEGVKHNCLCYVNRLFGDIINVKFRAVDKKLFTQETQPKEVGMPQAPFNIDALNPLGPSREGLLILTEGEKDVLAVLTAFAEGEQPPVVLSVPNGAESKPETCFEPFVEWLTQIRRVLILGDADRAGMVMKRNYMEFFRKMGKDCVVGDLSMGCKDIAECLQTFGVDEVRRIINEAPFRQHHDILHIKDMREGVKDVIRGNYDHGYSLGFGPITDQHLWLTDEGGLIVVTGKPNSGKTDWMRCVLMRLMMDCGKGCVFCSFEEPNKPKHIRRLIELYFGTKNLNKIPETQLDECLDRLDRQMAHLLMDELPPTPSNIIHYAEQLMEESAIPVRFLYVDPYLFMESEHTSESETQQIKMMLTTMQKWGRRNNVWVIMVAHPRKLSKDGMTGEYEEIDEYTISGSAHWANLADFLLSVKRVFPESLVDKDKGSACPSYTVVSVLKVRDQDLCHTGRIYFIRQPCGRYDELLDEDACKRALSNIQANQKPSQHANEEACE